MHIRNNNNNFGKFSFHFLNSSPGRGDVNICLGGAGSSYGSGDPALARGGGLTAPDSDNKHGNFPDLVNLGTARKWRQQLVIGDVVFSSFLKG